MKALLRELLERGTPLLGVCLGAQLLAEAVGPPSRPAKEPEIGWYEVELTPEGSGDPVLGPLAPGFTAFGWHRYEFDLPRGGTPLARSAACLQAYRLGDAAWGIQFHAEVTGEDADAWINDDRDDEDAARIGRRLRGAARAHRAARSGPGTSSAAGSAGASGRGRYSGVR